ncbi:hypothetical protein PRIPAC_80161 [Pristionchus pacificus]|uniref:G protein-coupled receptor n=1 Tax=Pristionchus pacificus TaxID=54126 RepID=A0A2A6CPL9_PRIPA|nr:hypothetical protein PRIPAC_80161 [Pristionchus pacificus]|eukprot:PDM79993.1 G protein-coupled receptor [Pristionchus pacificus]
MFARLFHDIFYGVSLALNCILIILIFKRTPKYLRSYSIVLLYLALVEISAAIGSLLIYKKVLSTSFYLINAITGICGQWESPLLCFSINAIHVAGIAHHAVMIAFCSCYRYYVIAFTRGEPARKIICFALCPILEGRELERVMNESHPEYDLAKHRLEEMLIVVPFNFSALLATYWVQGVIVPVFFVVIISYTQINKRLASIEHMSATSKRRHERILKAIVLKTGLLCQAVLPILYVLVVVSYRVETGQRIKNSEEVKNLLGVIGAILFALSPLCTLIFTPPYRNALTRIVSSKYGRYDSSIALPLNPNFPKPASSVQMTDLSHETDSKMSTSASKSGCETQSGGQRSDTQTKLIPELSNIIFS